jgi:tRNA threonylcarbamoyladenosine biosynthesis protein TsaE
VITRAISDRLGVTTRSPDQTRALASELAAVARAGDRIELMGELGAGKTEFAKGFAAGLDVREVVNSPSFTLMAEYSGRLPLFHLDLFRLAGADEIVGAGFLDERRREGATLIEWADRLTGALDSDALALRFTVLPDEERRIELHAGSARYARYLDAARRWSER